MAQYCRYCYNAFKIREDMIWCESKQICIDKNKVCRTNTCKDFSLNEIDVFDSDRTYKPKEIKHKDYEQLSLLESDE